MGLHQANSVLVKELFQVFIEMAVIVIAIVAEMKTVGKTGQVFYRPPDPHYLQCLFAGDACSGFKIALQGA